jgi:hypothetical protein
VSTLIFCKYILNFPFSPSKYPRYCLRHMCDKADCAMVAAFDSFWRLWDNHCNFSKISPLFVLCRYLLPFVVLIFYLFITCSIFLTYLLCDLIPAHHSTVGVLVYTGSARGVSTMQ